MGRAVTGGGRHRDDLRIARRDPGDAAIGLRLRLSVNANVGTPPRRRNVASSAAIIDGRVRSGNGTTTGTATTPTTCRTARSAVRPTVERTAPDSAISEPRPRVALVIQARPNGVNGARIR